mgnify:CR=1 FL=1
MKISPPSWTISFWEVRSHLARHQERGLDICGRILFGPDLFVVPVHELAAVRLLPALDASDQDLGLDVGLTNFVKVVLHPASASRASAATAPFELLMVWAWLAR